MAFVACTETTKGPEQKAKVLPYYGDFGIEIKYNEKGEGISDTVYDPIPLFAFTNQDGKIITNEFMAGKIAVVDFFFTNCTSICPMLSSQMARLQHSVQAENLNGQVVFLSHTVDPKNDTPEALKAYANRMGADFSNWNFVSGNAEDIYWQAKEGYKLTAFPSDTAQGGFFHTDQIALIDQEGKIRGYYDGTSTKAVDQLFLDLHLLLKK
ncbi:MAG: SCO family protein [Bacteroidota bacterium]